MSGSLLFLYWPDFTGSAPPLSRSLTGHSLRRYLCALYEDFEAYAWDPEPGAETDFAGWGIRMLPQTPDPDHVAAIARAHPGPEAVILAMSAERAEQIRQRLLSEGFFVEVWGPEGSNGPTRSLRQVLHLDTAHPLGVFLDGPALDAAAAELGRSGEAIRSRLVEVAGIVGSVLQACLFSEDGRVSDLAGFDPLDGEGRLPDHLRSIPENVRTWIIVSHADWLAEAVRMAHSAGVRILLWPPDEARVAPEVLAEADGWCPLTAVLDLPPRLPRAAQNAPGPHIHADVRIAAHTTNRPEDPLRAGTPLPSLSESARLGPLVRLVYHVECIHREAGAARLPLERLAAALAEADEFGPTAANAMGWLNRGRAEGLLLISEDAGGAECRINSDHPVCRGAVEVPDRCLRLLFQMLQKIPWVSFKLLRSVLMREQWLGGPPYRLEETTVDEWLNFLIQNGAIRMTKEPNLVNPEYPVTALRLNEAHPLSRFVASEATESTRLAAERAILAVDHFLTRNRKPWMAMGALRRALDGMTREELQSVLQGLQNLGALITESYPNPQKEHFTTGCRLKLDEPIVARALQIRNGIIHAAQRQGLERGWIPISRLEDSLNGLSEAGSTSQRLAWFILLRDEGILELDQEPLLPHAPGEVRCRLNVADAVVRAVISRDGPAYYELD